MRTRIVSITILSLILLSGATAGCSENADKATVNGKNKVSEKEIAAQEKQEPETAHIILQFRGCKAHQ